jgi:Limiting CO2-inducible proteins B/C beta carbonyic anhydrases
MGRFVHDVSTMRPRCVQPMLIPELSPLFPLLSNPQSKIAKVFPKSIPNEDLVRRVAARLGDFGYTRTNTLLASSLCCDELARPLEASFAQLYGQNFSMGGLAGMPFGGLTSFGAMAAHIPDGGSCLVVYGPHVGVDMAGNVGTVERRGREKGGACCGSACAASGYALGVFSGKSSPAPFPTEVLDAQQAMVGNLLLPHAERLSKAADTMVELPMALFDVQKGMIENIVEKGAGNVADGTIAVVGGIQINTPEDYSDYFMPLQFDLFSNKGAKIETLMWSD